MLTAILQVCIWNGIPVLQMIIFGPLTASFMCNHDQTTHLVHNMNGMCVLYLYLACNHKALTILLDKSQNSLLLFPFDKTKKKTIRETILASYPTHSFLGEEDVPPGAEASAKAIDEKLKNCESGFLWIVDPIDGTVSCSCCKCFLLGDCKVSYLSYFATTIQ